jgi:hypothetical protein
MPVLCEFAQSDALAVAAAIVGRFYGDGLRWAMALPLPELWRWRNLIGHVRESEPPAAVAVYRQR